MIKLSGILLVIAASVLLSGCLIVNPPPNPPPAAPAPSPTASPVPQEDTRSIGQLRTENNDLRGKLAKAEKDRKAWESAVDYRKSQLKAVERDRDRVKKERDEAKKAAKKADKD
jgi:hypothetical protein